MIEHSRSPGAPPPTRLVVLIGGLLSRRRLTRLALFALLTLLTLALFALLTLLLFALLLLCLLLIGLANLLGLLGVMARRQRRVLGDLAARIKRMRGVVVPRFVIHQMVLSVAFTGICKLVSGAALTYREFADYARDHARAMRLVFIRPTDNWTATFVMELSDGGPFVASLPSWETEAEREAVMGALTTAAGTMGARKVALINNTWRQAELDQLEVLSVVVIDGDQCEGCYAPIKRAPGHTPQLGEWRSYAILASDELADLQQALIKSPRA